MLSVMTCCDVISQISEIFLCILVGLKVEHFFLFYFLRDQNSQHFNENLLGVNASAFSFFYASKQLIVQAPPIM